MRRIVIALALCAVLHTETPCTAQSESSYLAHLSRELIHRQLLEISTKAKLYYNTPLENGGGGQSFHGLTLSRLIVTPENANGAYSIAAVYEHSIIVSGTGWEIGDNGSYVNVTLTVLPDCLYVAFNN